MPDSATDCGPALALSVISASGASVGASLTELTTSRKLSVTELPLVSVAEIVIVAVPNSWAAGVTVTRRLESTPEITAPEGGTNTGFEDATVTMISAAGVSASETVNVIGPVDESSAMTWSPSGEITGIPSMVTVNVRETRISPSFTVTVTEAMPFVPGFGESNREPLAAGEVYVTSGCGTRLGLLDTA